MKQIEILGGGIASLATAFHLTRNKNWRDRYRIRVHQHGSRLGGKAASFRRDGRIHEHGFHAFMEFYVRAFALLDECYAELHALGDPPPFATGRAAFEPRDKIGFIDEHGHWSLTIRPDGEPPPATTDSPDAETHWMMGWLARRLAQVPAYATVRAEIAAELSRLSGSTKAVLRVSQILSPELLLARSALVPALPLIVPQLAFELNLAPNTLTHDLWNVFRRRHWELFFAQGTPEQQREAILTDLGLALAAGLQAPELQDPPFYDYPRLDHQDFRTFLHRYGANPETLESPIVQGGYDITFSPRGGLGAGAGLMGAVSLLHAKEALYYVPRRGLGEVLIAPLYRLLRARGVEFEFFSSIERLRVEKGKLVGIDRVRQAKVRDGKAYDPLEKGDYWYWPDRPHFEQLEHGAELAASGVDLESKDGWRSWHGVESEPIPVGEDTIVVLGISLGALPGIAEELSAADPSFRDMLATVRTMQTFSSQVWFPRRPSSEPWSGQVRGGCPPVFDTWVDMSELTGTESCWQKPDEIGLIYLCGSQATNATHGVAPVLGTRDELVKQSEQWLSDHLERLWPGTTLDEAIERYHHFSDLPSDLYVRCDPGSTAKRLRAHGTRFVNLFLAGDWTRTSLNAGCLESAVESGENAAKAVLSHL